MNRAFLEKKWKFYISYAFKIFLLTANSFKGLIKNKVLEVTEKEFASQLLFVTREYEVLARLSGNFRAEFWTHTRTHTLILLEAWIYKSNEA